MSVAAEGSNLPVVVLVGRPNVGKSTLFNRLTRTRDAIVADIPGLTRDRHYGHGRMGSRPYLVVDTGGFEPVNADGVMRQMAKQTLQAIDEADVVIFVADGRLGMAGRDKEIADILRRSGRPSILAVNKLEGRTSNVAASAEFYEVGLGEPFPISASHGDGVYDLIESALALLPQPQVDKDDAEDGDQGADADAAFDPDDASLEGLDEAAVIAALEQAEAQAITVGADGKPVAAAEPAHQHAIKVAIVGRPNVGKSTLINALLGEERVIAFDQPGTTRDSITIPFERGGRKYALIDTAGIRRKGKVTDMIEKFSVIKTLQAIENANVIVLMLDARQDISDQDAHIAGYVLESGRALVVGVNKWDGLDESARDNAKREIGRKLHFLAWAKFHYISALHGHGVQALLRSVDAAHKAAFIKLSTPKLTRTLHDAVEKQPAPRRGLFRPKMRYAHQGGQNPPIVVIHGSGLDDMVDSYRRYLEGRFRETFSLYGTPLRIEFRSSNNPYAKDKS